MPRLLRNKMALGLLSAVINIITRTIKDGNQLYAGS